MTAEKTPAFRLDIQALRGLAVLFVLADHAKIPWVDAGYLGVDIFFVISGYLITNLIARSIECDAFRFSEFYIRRAKRLLPAAYATFVLTVLFSIVLLDGNELRDFTKQLIGALTFTANFVLYRQSGYFEGSSALKPLLHVWSLSLEEQYYMLIPAALFLTPRRYWLIGMVTVLFASLGLCLLLAPIKQVAAFYLLPTRGWEFAIGSIGALASSKILSEKVCKFLLWPALLIIATVPCRPTGYFHPGLDALLVCISTLIVILAKRAEKNFTAIAFAKVGDFSYSLYLIHWPIFAFINNVWVGNNVPIQYRLFALTISFFLGYLMYCWIELPFRQSRVNPAQKSIIATLCISAVLVVTSIAASANSKDFREVSRNAKGLSDSCDSSDRFIPTNTCTTSKSPKILIWGDSFAMALVAGVVSSTQAGVVQATSSNCGPLINIAPIVNDLNSDVNVQWAKRCIRRNQSILDYISKSPSIEVVVLSSAFSQYEDGSTYRQLILSKGRFQESPVSSESVVAAQVATIKLIRQLGKRVVLVAPPPETNFNAFRCLERKLSKKIFMGAPESCNMPIETYHNVSAPVIDFLKQVETRTGVQTIRFDSYLCSDTVCSTFIDGIFIYRDGGHLSYDGVRLLAKRMDLGGQIYPDARSASISR